MRVEQSQLRQRILTALTLLSVASSLFVGIALWSSDTFIEDAVVRDLMRRELDLHAEPDGSLGSGVPHRTLHYFDRNNVPDALRHLDPGYYSEVAIGDDEYDLLVRDLDGGGRGYLAYDISFVEHRERVLAMTATLLMLLAVVTSTLLARRAADRALKPLQLLVAQVRGLDPQRRGQRLQLAQDDRDLQVFVRSMNEYMTRLDDLVERERAFAAAASHELRTPLAVIQGASETLALDDPSPALARMQRAVHEAGNQLDALLALSRVNESPPLEEIELDGFLHAVAEDLGPGSGDAQLVWDVPLPVTLRASPGAVAVVFGNLLRNALRAAGAGRVVIRLRQDFVEVQDDGPGIPEDELPRVFEPRFHGRDGGSGMGLYIASVLAQRFGWSLRLANHPDRGAVARWQLRPDAA